ncbi:MAG: hypothetical protein RLY83_465 [Actinomycetota bacterium]
MATDYDAPRKNDDDTTSLEEIKEGAAPTPRASDDMDEGDGHFEIAEAVHEDLEVVVVPKQEDEFTCMECFIVKHRSQLAAGSKNTCAECAG